MGRNKKFTRKNMKKSTGVNDTIVPFTRAVQKNLSKDKHLKHILIYNNILLYWTTKLFLFLTGGH